jgi:carboxylesterase
MLNSQDFCFMRQGVCLGSLNADKEYLLHPIEIKHHTTGRALLLIHGFASSPAVYRNIIPHLTDYDAIFCPVLPGHGQSLADFSKTKAEDWLSFIEQKFDAIAQQYKNIDVMGLSLGGLLACHLTKHRTIEQLYLLAPALALNKSRLLSSGLVNALMHCGLKYLTNRGGGVLNPANYELTFRKLPMASIYEIFHLIETFELEALSCKTILFLGRHDEVINNKKVKKLLCERVTHLTIVDLERSAHVLPLDYDMDIIIEKMQSTRSIYI